MSDIQAAKRKRSDHWTMTQGARRAVLALFAMMVVLGGASVGLGARTADHLQATQSAQARTERTQAATVLKLNRTVRRLDALVGKLRREVTANCAVDHDLAPLPVTAGPTGKASLLGVEIVADFRGAWHKAGCPGTLARPAPSLIRWARYYHLPIR